MIKDSDNNSIKFSVHKYSVELTVEEAEDETFNVKITVYSKLASINKKLETFSYKSNFQLHTFENHTILE